MFHCREEAQNQVIGRELYLSESGAGPTPGQAGQFAVKGHS